MESTQALTPTFAIGDEIVHKGIGNRNLFWTVKSFHAGGIGVESHYAWGFIATRDLESYEIR